MIIESFGKLLILLGAGIWLGGFIMLGFGVAPVNFGVAEQWQLEGENPRMADQVVNYRTIGGELTGNSIARLNIIETFCFFMIVIGIVIAWNKETGNYRNRVIRTVLVLFIGALFYYYGVSVGGRLMELRNTIPINFSIEDTALKSAEHLEFDRLHKTYTRVASLAMIAIFALFTATVFDKDK